MFGEGSAIQTDGADGGAAGPPPALEIDPQPRGPAAREPAVTPSIVIEPARTGAADALR